MVVCVRVRNSLQTNFTFPFFAKQHSPFTRQAKSRLFLVITIFSLLFSLKTCHIASCVLIIFLKALNPSNYPCCCMKLEKCCNYRQTDILESNVKGKIQKTYASNFFPIQSLYYTTHDVILSPMWYRLRNPTRQLST